MTTALQNPFVPSAETRPKLRHSALAADRVRSEAVSDRATNLMALLASGPIDLAAICSEIRLRPGLEALLARLTSSLGLAPEIPLATLDQAIVVLGADRLRVLIGLWSSQEGAGSQASEISDEHSSEARYLAAFVRYLGFDPGDLLPTREWLPQLAAKIAVDQPVTLADIFMRDFFTLLPAVEPVLPHPRARSASAAVLRGRQRAPE